MKYCSSCDLDFDNEELFCDDCGAKLGEKSSLATNIDELPNALTNEAQWETQKELPSEAKNSSAPKAVANSLTSWDAPLNEADKNCPIEAQWNEGLASNLISGLDQGLQIRLRSEQMTQIENLAITVRLPNGQAVQKQVPRSYHSSCELSLNLPGNCLKAAYHCSMEVFFTFRLDNKIHAYQSQLYCNIHENSSQKNINIQMGDINIGSGNQADRAADQYNNINVGDIDLLGDLGKQEAQRQAQLLNKESSWSPLACQKTSLSAIPQAMSLNSASSTDLSQIFGELPQSLTIELNSGHKVHIFTQSTLSLGRSKEADLLTRNYPEKTHPDFKNEFKRINVQVSGKHAELNFDDNGFYFRDGIDGKASSNHSSLNGKKATKLETLSNTGEINLAPSTPSSFKLKYQVLSGLNELGNTQKQAALLLSRSDEMKQSYLILREGIELNKIFELEQNLEIHRQGEGLYAKVQGEVLCLDAPEIQNAVRKVSSPAELKT